MATGKNKKSSKGNQKAKQRNLNNETILSLKRLTLAIQELDHRRQQQQQQGTTSPSSSQKSPPAPPANTCTTTTTVNNPALIPFIDPATVPLLRHWRNIPADIMGAYQMLHDGAQLIKTISTKYTLMGKISIEDGSQFATELRQGCELLSTAAFLVHNPNSGCARSTRRLVKQRCLAVVQSVTTLMESFVSSRALEGNVGAQLTGAVWHSCEEIMEKTPKGNRACMMKELFTWVKECNETMEEFEELIGLGPLEEKIVGEEDNDEAVAEGYSKWDEFCEKLGTGEHYAKDEMPIVKACLALIKCSRGIIGLSLKALECAGSAVECHGEASDENEGKVSRDSVTDSSHHLLVFQWMGNLHETCRMIGEGVTNLGCALYPPLNLSLANDSNDDDNDDESWTRTEIGKQVIIQRDWLLSAARVIDKPVIGSDDTEIEMTAEVRDMCSKLSTAIKKRVSEAEHAIQQAIDERR